MEQESYTTFTTLGKLLPTAINEKNLEKSTLKLLDDNYADEADISILTTEMVIWKQIFIDVNPVCFSDFVSHLQTLKSNEILLISNIMVTCNFLFVHLARNATPGYQDMDSEDQLWVSLVSTL